MMILRFDLLNIMDKLNRDAITQGFEKWSKISGHFDRLTVTI